ncbi:hypothetical protein [Candidatus Hodgkinia cicadicola]|uniref:hypothetical protein n=1 Tax=Candidatus Hodgkinia cicadicola TaxID=573658 RepID=UPI0024158133
MAGWCGGWSNVWRMSFGPCQRVEGLKVEVGDWWDWDLCWGQKVRSWDGCWW